MTKPEELIGMDVLGLLPEDRRPVLSDDLELRLAKSQAVQSHEGAIRRLDGTRVEVEAGGTPFRFEGHPGALLVIRDITERKRAEEALRHSEEKYRTLVETSPDAVIMADLKGHTTFVSRRTLELYGSEHVEELLGRPATDFIAPEDHERLLGNLQRTKDEGVTRDIKYAFVRKDGTEFPGEASAIVIRDAAGKPIGLTILVRDITERKQADEALRQAHDQLQTIYDGITEGLVITDIETKRFVRVNSSLCQMLGYSEKELLAASVIGQGYSPARRSAQ